MRIAERINSVSSVAEIAKKPLYRVTCGDIGTKAEVVEKVRLLCTFYHPMISDLYSISKVFFFLGRLGDVVRFPPLAC